MGSLLSVKGRLNRARYFGYMIVLNILVGVISAIIQTTVSGVVLVIGIILLLVSCIVDIFIVIKRFHDLNRPGIHFLLLLIPLYNIYLAFVLLFKKGTEGPNKYGEDPLRR
jgi:uncharacterized membrane protein YhaH (DUF805 family)